MNTPTFEQLEKELPPAKGKTKSAELPDAVGEPVIDHGNPAALRMVSAQEADANMAKRLRGEMPPIRQAATRPVQVADKPRAARKPPAASAQQATEHYDAFTGNDVQIDDLDGTYVEPRQPDRVSYTASPGVVSGLLKQQSEAAIPSYFKQRIRVCLTLQDGTMYLPAVSVIPSEYSITILLPTDDNNVTFIPKPASAITVATGDKIWKCYFPGAHFDIPELKVIGLVFIRADEKV